MHHNRTTRLVLSFGILALASNFNLSTLRGCGIPVDGIDGDPGFEEASSGDITNFDKDNSSPLTGGDGTNGTDGGNGGEGGDGLSIDADGSITGVNLRNSAPITGGNGGNGGDSDASGGNGGNGGAGIAVEANNNISGVDLENSGPVTGGHGGDGGNGNSGGGNGGNGGVGVLVNVEDPSGTIDGVTLNNSAPITGGDGGDAGTGDNTAGGGGHGFNVSADGDVTHVDLKNSSTIRGGNGGDSNGGDFILLEGDGDNEAEVQGSVAGEGGNGVNIESFSGNVAHVTLENTGIDSIIGGDGGNNVGGGNSTEGGNGGHAVNFEAGNNLDDIELLNGGTIRGGKGGNNTLTGDDGIAGAGGNGVNFSSEGTITNVRLQNSGSITGGEGGEITSDGGDPKAGKGGEGIAFSSVNEDTSNGSISDITLTNNKTGTITGGEGGGADSSNLGNGNNDDPHGGIGGHGISITAGALENEDGLGTTEIARVTLLNEGAITGGDGGGASNSFDDTNDTSDAGSVGGNGGDGVRFQVLSETGRITDISVTNCGTITGGNGAPAEGDTINTGGNGGDGIRFSARGELNNITVINFGTIRGGEGNDPGGSYSQTDDNVTTTTVFGNGGHAIDFNFDGGPEQIVTGTSTNLVVTNFGTLIGGDLGDGGNAGSGIRTNANNLTVNNWGNISGGGDVPDVDALAVNAVTPKVVFPVALAPAILITGSDNRVNLRGFSVINGTVSADGSPNNSNVLNFAFDGVSPARAAALHAELESLGVLNGLDSSGSIVFRGETYEWDDIIIELNTMSYQQQGITPNQKSVGQNLDGFTSTPSDDFRKLLEAIDLSGNVPAALEQLSPQRYQLYSDIAVANATFNTLEIDERLNNLRDGTEGVIDSHCLKVATSQVESQLGLSKNDSKVVLPAKDVEVPEREEEARRVGAFVSGNVIVADVDAHGGDLEDNNFTSWGVLGGLDVRVYKNLVVGAMVGHDHTDADLDREGDSKAKIDTYTGGVYASYHGCHWFINALGTYSSDDYDSRRTVIALNDCPTPDVLIARGDTSGNHYVGNIDGGYDFRFGRHVTVSPTAGLQYVNVEVDSFDETEAAPANLAVHCQSADSLRSRLGGRLGIHGALCRSFVLGVEARIAWQHEFLDDSRAITAEFIGAGLGPFDVRTTDPQRDAALVGGGVNATLFGFLTIFADYDAQVGQADYVEQSGKAGLRVSF